MLQVVELADAAAPSARLASVAAFGPAEAARGLGRGVALCDRSSTLCQIHRYLRYLCFRTDDATEP
jgi:hypothetical protein